MSEVLKNFLSRLYNNIFSSIYEPSNLSYKIIFTIIILVIAFWLSNVGKKKLWNMSNDLKVYTIFKKSMLTVIWFIALLLLLGTWIHAKNSLIVILLIIIAMLVFSVKNLSMEIVGWMMLLNRKLFKLYDRIEIKGNIGDVVKITPLYFKIIERGEGLSTESPTGKVISIPNHVLLEESLVNYSNFTEINWKEVTYPIVIDGDWQSAKRICEEELEAYMAHFKLQYTEDQLREIEAKISLFDGELDSKINVLLEDETIVIICYFPVKYTDGSTAKSYLNERILPRLNEHPNIELSGERMHIDMRN